MLQVRCRGCQGLASCMHAVYAHSRQLMLLRGALLMCECMHEGVYARLCAVQA